MGDEMIAAVIHENNQAKRRIQILSHLKDRIVM